VSGNLTPNASQGAIVNQTTKTHYNPADQKTYTYTQKIWLDYWWEVIPNSHQPTTPCGGNTIAQATITYTEQESIQVGVTGEFPGSKVTIAGTASFATGIGTTFGPGNVQAKPGQELLVLFVWERVQAVTSLSGTPPPGTSFPPDSKADRGYSMRVSHVICARCCQ
jgi:hypothetical protein